MSQATYVRTADLPIDRLATFPGNAKKGDIPAILDSLRRNAQYRAVVARQEGKKLIVLAGNNTLLALREHGPGDCGVTFQYEGETLPCGVCRNAKAYKPTLRTEIVECDDDTARRANLADNKTSDAGTYDDAALAELLSGLDGLEGTAYDTDELDELLKATGALGDASSEFLNSFIEAAPLPAPTQPVPADTPALNPFSAADVPAGAPQTGPVSSLPQTAAEGDQPPVTETAPAPHSPGVHTGPEAYSGPGARMHPGEPIALPVTPQMVPLQWVFTLDQRDTVRAAIKAEQAAGGHDTAALALTAICRAYVDAATTSDRPLPAPWPPLAPTPDARRPPPTMP
ncbi:hypothetical protein ACIRD4_34120 [Streptomyces clavifer]|uniref:hypothetical protein n=1 Tax=Streptomyces clavifer TaxID=68188 RepID=UPI0037F646FE